MLSFESRREDTVALAAPQPGELVSSPERAPCRAEVTAVPGVIAGESPGNLRPQPGRAPAGPPPQRAGRSAGITLLGSKAWRVRSKS